MLISGVLRKEILNGHKREKRNGKRGIHIHFFNFSFILIRKFDPDHCH
jgi:hypothetical protein